MESRLTSNDVAVDALVDQDEDESYLAPSQHLGDSRYDPEVVVSNNEKVTERHEQLTLALAELDDRSKDIVSRRWLGENKPTLHDLAEEYGVSAERIRQIEKRAMEKMKSVISIQA